MARCQCSDNTLAKKAFVYKDPIYPQSRLQQPAVMLMRHFKTLFPTALDVDDLYVFEQTMTHTYQEHRKKLSGKELDGSAQIALEKKEWNQAIVWYVQEFCSASDHQQDKIQDEIIDALCDLVRNHSPLNEESLKALYILAGHTSKHARAPLYQALITIPDDAHNYESVVRDTILLLMSLIRQGDSSALEALAHHYCNLTWYHLAHTCYQLAHELGLRHADCALGNFYHQLIYDFYNNPNPALTEYFPPKHVQQERAEYLRKMLAHYKQCWHRHGCLYAQERVVTLLGNTFMVATMELSDQERNALLDEAAQHNNQEAKQALRRLYCQQGNYEKALEYCDESQDGLYHKAILYEKLGHLDKAERQYLTIAFPQHGQPCPSELIRLYQQQKKEAWHYELIEAYHNQWHNYCRALLLEHTKNQDAQAEHFLMNSLQQAETLKALERLIQKKLCTHQQLIATLEESIGDQAFKDTAYKLITQSQLTS